MYVCFNERIHEPIICLLRPSTFAQAAKLRRVATAKERELTKSFDHKAASVAECVWVWVDASSNLLPVKGSKASCYHRMDNPCFQHQCFRCSSLHYEESDKDEERRIHAIYSVPLLNHQCCYVVLL